MRLQLLLIFWMVLMAWSSQVAASAMAHCQTHTDVILIEDTTAGQTIDNHGTGTELTLLTVLLTNSSANFQQVAAKIHAGNGHNTAADTMDCCDHHADQHHCSGSCPSCDGCSTAHGAAMPSLWRTTTTIAQQKIQYFDDFYPRSQSSTQERPPKN